MRADLVLPSPLQHSFPTCPTQSHITSLGPGSVTQGSTPQPPQQPLGLRDLHLHLRSKGHLWLWSYLSLSDGHFIFFFSSGMAFGFPIFCAVETCSSETFLVRVTNGYFCSANILVLFSFNVAEIPRPVPDYSPLSLVTALDCLHPTLWSH